MRDVLVRTLEIIDWTVLAYFLTVNTLYLVFSLIAFFALLEHRRRWTTSRLAVVMRSPATPAISIVVPAYNEAVSIEQSLRSLLLLNHPEFEIIVVNDGSTDGTLDTMIASFELLRAPLAYPQALPTRPVKAAYRSFDHPELMIVDKENGGKADAVNAGINAARHPLVCVIDADSILEPLALLRAALPFIEHPDTLATGGIIRVVNGCRVEAGRVTEVGMPRAWLARFQVVEYLRAFLNGRVALSSMNALMIISGAFGLFRRDALVEVGGFRQDTIGEDMEVVAHMHRHWRQSGRPYRIVFLPDPVCWTEVPEELSVLERQRNRWQRGTCQVLSYHLAMAGNPRYGAVGWFGMPYYLLVEALGPVIETLGYVVTIAAVSFGLLDWVFAELFFLVAVVFGTLISLTCVLLEEMSFRRYPRTRDVLWLAALAVLENFGYRQLTSWWRFKGVVAFLRKQPLGWGAMTKRGFGAAAR